MSRGGRFGSSYATSNECHSINALITPGICSHYCENTRGSYRCRCAKGWTLAGDQRRCKPAGDATHSNAYVLYMLPNKIRSIGLASHDEHLLVEINSLDMKVSLSFD